MMTKYKQSTDNIYSVSDNNPRKSFDELYEEYSSMSIPEQLNNLKRLGRELVTKIDKIIDNLDDILEGESNDSSWLYKRRKKGLEW